MPTMLFALGRSLRSLLRMDVFVHLIWPGIVAALLWTVALILSWAVTIEAVMRRVENVWWVGAQISDSEMLAGIALLLVKIAVLLAVVPLIYVTAVVLVAVVALPLMLDRVAARDYADLEQRRGGSIAGSVWNTVVALALFTGVLAVSLLLWWIPGVALVAPVLATGWLNQRLFGYDALMNHADHDELVRLRHELRSPMLLLGSNTALLAYVPVVNLIAPAFAGLAFAHFMLEALRRDRLKNGVSILDPEPTPTPAELPENLPGGVEAQGRAWHSKP
ncbi:hypothetical protein AGMMS49960_19100 [Betaproteobacteria bacterium]|nr:hypothetical protein AGMMS49543_22530 [Betaproteobacteria bacterium]GHU03980.1 hypothetical protein AGMMS49960_19100 [Betaproteobacteria bacterium]GHU19209.1 hypothetical protein AGMMS50243_10720 [Betaproteobacteria bacterium]